MNATIAEQKRVNLVSEYFKKAYDSDSKVVYVNSFVPSEILLPFGLIPFNLGTVGGIFAQAKAAGTLINTAEQHYYSNDLCSTSRCLVGAAYKNALPTPDFLVLTSGPCDVDAHLIQTLSNLYNKKFILLDVPLYYENPEDAIAYLAAQIKRMVATLEECLQRPFAHDKFESVVAYSNDTVSTFERINECAKAIPCPLSIVESIDVVSSMHLLGTKELFEVYEEKHEEVLKRIQSEDGGDERRPRVLWHWLRPYYTNELFDYLNNNCRLDVISEYNVMGNDFYGLEHIDVHDPYRSLAKRMLRIADNYGIANQRFIQQLPGRVKEYSIDGVISFIPRGCRHLASLNQVVRDIMTAGNMPFLEIDCDCIDERDYSFAQIKTRIDAFSELLYGRM